MSFSFSQPQTSSFLAPNELLDLQTLRDAPQVAADIHQNRALAAQTTQQELTAHDIAMTGQAAAPLLNMNEDQAAAAYPGWLQEMQSRGLAKYAPATYPGHAATQALVQRAMPILQQIQTGYVTPPGSADATKRLNDIYTGAGTTTTAPASSTGGTAGGPPGLATAESGGRSDVINAQGYTGTYQFGKQRLADLGYYTPAQGENMGDNTTWSGRVSVPGFNVTDQKSFAANPAAQQVVYQTHMANIDKAIDQMPNAGNFDRNGLRAVAHLGGIAGMERFASSGGMYDPADANGTRLSSYYKRFSGGAPGASTTAAATSAAPAAPVITGDSIASSGGLGGSGVVGDSSAKVLARVQAESRAGKYDGKPVVLSTGASNDFGSDLGSVEQQIREAQAGNAGKITVLGVGPAVEAKAPGTNAKLAALSKAYGADFVPLPADQMSPDGVHPTAQGYATLKATLAPPQGAAGGGGQPGRYQVASNAPTPPPASAAAPAPLPRDQAVAQAQRTGQAVPVAGVDGLWALPNGNLSSTPPATAQPQAQIPQPPANRAMPGSPGGPPAPTPPPAAQPPGARGNLPRAADVPTGLQSPQIQQAQDLLHRAAQLEMVAAQNPYDKRLAADAAAKAADLKQRAQILMQSDNVVQTQEGQLHTLTGKLDESAKPLADYHETSPGSGIWVGGPGTDPKFQPPGRLIIDKAGDVWRTTTGGAEKLSRLDPAAVAALNEAAAAGTATGTATAKQLPEMMAQARNAAAQEGQIDYAANQLREAAKGGVPTGYFSQGLASAAAAAKSLGLDGALRAVGVNPEAVGNVQTAQKTLSVIGGAILRQALGPGSAITDGKIEAFIHTQPGIETDPQALQRIMAWARSQYTYERELGTAAVTEAAKPENAGRLPPHWLPAYYRDHGFAPIYDPGTQEMRQPDGSQSPRETLPASQNAPVFKEGQTATANDGHKIVFRNGNWVPQ